MSISRRYIGYAIIFVISFLGISYWNFYMISRPSSIEISFTPDAYVLATEDVILTTQDNLKLSAWYIPPPNQNASNTPAIILLHGYPTEKSDMLSVASRLWPQFGILLVDMRYFGDSEGRFTSFGVLERSDTSIAIDYLKERGHGKIGLFGFSMGGAIAIATAAEDERVDAVASFAAYADMKQFGYEVYKQLLFLKRPMVNLMMLWGKLTFGQSPQSITPIAVVNDREFPLFILHQSGDTVIGHHHAELLYDSVTNKDRADLHLITAMSHGDITAEDSAKILNFFEDNLSK